jgi:hypothetical protein
MTTTTKARKILQATQKMTPQEREKMWSNIQKGYYDYLLAQKNKLATIQQKLKSLRF